MDTNKAISEIIGNIEAYAHGWVEGDVANHVVLPLLVIIKAQQARIEALEVENKKTVKALNQRGVE